VKRGARFEIWHQTGVKDLAGVEAVYQQMGIAARCTAFIDEVPQAYAWADLLICRAGASTVSEVALAGVAALFIPLPHAIDDHQTANARTLSDEGAAWLLPQSSCTPDLLGERLADFDREALMQMAIRAKSKGMPGAAQVLARWVSAAAGSPLGVSERTSQRAGE
jgi:UDP-N-acetylglucosamine--N-acetylmuramyl-(pentapeptide) pyrophosphoryl-undecaprenol N-acetylglucosamine transferase